jgi:hypothetical protein
LDLVWKATLALPLFSSFFTLCYAVCGPALLAMLLFSLMGDGRFVGVESMVFQIGAPLVCAIDNTFIYAEEPTGAKTYLLAIHLENDE